MRTKNLIKRKSLELFNKNGVRNVTLRDVAKELDKSYGNITYHFPTKGQLLSKIFSEIIEEITKVEKLDLTDMNIFKKYLRISELNYSLLKKYYFVIIDKRDLRTIYPELIGKFDFDSFILKSKRISTLIELQEQGLIKKNLTISFFDFIFELTSGLNITFFQDFRHNENLEKEYILKMKKLLFPYLTDKGKLLYIKF